MELGLTHTEELGAVYAARAVKLLVLHRQEALPADCFIIALYRLNLLAENWQSDLLADEVRVGSQLNQVRMGVAVAELPHEAFLDHFLIGSLVIGDVQGCLLGQGAAFTGE